MLVESFYDLKCSTLERYWDNFFCTDVKNFADYFPSEHSVGYLIENTIYKYLFQLGKKNTWLEYLDLLLGNKDETTLIAVMQEVHSYLLHELPSSLLSDILSIDDAENNIPEISTDTENCYQRYLLSVLPYQKGVLSSFLFVFPKHMMSLPHKHPEYVIEDVLVGNVVELEFVEKQSGFEYCGNVLRNTKDCFLSLGEGGMPHMVYASDSHVVTLATFAGQESTDLIPTEHILNKEKLQQCLNQYPVLNRNQLDTFLNN